jgi:hypothetical protein
VKSRFTQGRTVNGISDRLVKKTMVLNRRDVGLLAARVMIDNIRLEFQQRRRGVTLTDAVAA